MVPEIMTGSVDAALLEKLLDGEERRLGVQRVEDGLDQHEVRAAFDQARVCFAIGGHQFVEGDVAEAGIVDVRREEAVRLVGPSAPATKRGFAGRAQMHRPRSRASRRRFPVQFGTSASMP
jgi:hypothetical protein